MSVALLVSYKNGKRAALYLPIATEGLFGRWLDGAEALGLEWMKLFGNPGVPVPVENLLEVIQEFAKIQAWFHCKQTERRDFEKSKVGAFTLSWFARLCMSKRDGDEATSQYCIERTARVIEALENLVGDDDIEEIFIG